ncbi:MAG TPA: UvrD-helicase domain-containing protein [Candidatus Dormibacteraeota bacterium]|nr:UvrD-helicase domain-containing protein [Candidatus Dormibacteraeota bacterium]
MSLLDDLNPGQRKAVEAAKPVVVVAGAGTGKTRVITYRVAWLISQGVRPEAILAVTFTNKAATEMKERIRALVPEAGAAPWVGTFHSFCARLLRQDGPLIGIPRDFAIYDDEDQTSVVRQALRRLGRDERQFSPRSLREPISYAKNNGWDSERMRMEADRVFDKRARLAADVFDFYVAALKQAGALDFDDLLLEAVRLLRSGDEARARWRGRFEHIVVDEFQDVNEKQYEMVRLLAGENSCVCVVGDEDQSIYSWRGADPGILQRFLEDFPGAEVLRVETNYRSTQTILDAAAAVVAHNSGRLGKNLTATRTGEQLVRLQEAIDGTGEAATVVHEIGRLLRKEPEASVAILYRTNFQSRPFEEACRRAGLVFRLVGGFSFYQRAEVKDLLAYARMMINPDDDVALARVINTPVRGIGEKTVESLRAAAAEDKISLWAALVAASEAASNRTAAALAAFRQLIEGLRAGWENRRPAELLRELAGRTGYLESLEQQDRAEFTDRASNVKELVSAAEEAEEQGETLLSFLDRAALVSDADSYDAHAPVTLITLHSAKGLEFDHVFLVGMEENLFPHARSMASEAALEEERRLCYVGMTRARRTLTLTRAHYRRSYDRRSQTATMPSRFLAEVPEKLMETVAAPTGGEGSGVSFSPSAMRQPDRSTHWAGNQAGDRAGETFDEAPRFASRLGGTPKTLIGRKVRHPTFGLGTIVDVESDGEDRRFTVSFARHGTRKLIERYAKLERV